MFQLKTRVSIVDSFTRFASEYALNDNDVIITQSFIYEQYIKNLNLSSHFIMQDEYGSGEPTDEMMNAILKVINKLSFNRIIAVGGGTVIDISKIFVLNDVHDVTDVFERRIPIQRKKTLVIVPTTCGTGSEVTNISIAEIKSKQTKMGLSDDVLYADDAVLIPELLQGLPLNFYLFSAIDALIHAAESFVSPRADRYSRIFSKEAIVIIMEVFRKMYLYGPECRLERLEDILVAANYAGIAFGNAGVGAVHAMSYPFSAAFHVPHGEANYQFFTEVFRFYDMKNPHGVIKELKDIFSDCLMLRKPERIIVFNMLENVVNDLIPKNKLRHYGMKESDIDLFTENVVQTQQRLLNNNYVAMTKEDIRNIYFKLY